MGALINAAAGMCASAVSEAASAGDAGADARSPPIFLIAATIITMSGYVALAFLTGTVLRQKLPALSRPVWMALYTVFGIIWALTAALPWSQRAEHSYEFKLDEFLFVSTALAAFGALLGAIIGSLQGLVLRKAARGIGFWIGFSALAGLSLTLVVPGRLLWSSS